MTHFAMFRITLFFALLLLIAPPLNAQSGIKGDVFDDCPHAKSELVNLNDEDRSDFLLYLARVISLPWDYSTELPSSSNPTFNNAPLDPSELWKTLSPERNLRAKECALTLAGLLLPESVRLTPALIQLLEDPFLSLELRNEVRNKIVQLSVTASESEVLKLPNSFYKELLQFNRKGSAFYAELVLAQIDRYSVAALTKVFKKSSIQRRYRIIELLQRILPADKEREPAIISLHHSADEMFHSDDDLLFYTPISDLRESDRTSIFEFPKKHQLSSVEQISLLMTDGGAEDKIKEISPLFIPALTEMGEGNEHKESQCVPVLPFAIYRMLFEGQISKFAPQQKAAVIKALPLYQNEALSMLEQIKPFLDSEDDSVRYEAVVAISKIAPFETSLPIVFRQMLVAPQAKKLRKEELPLALKPLLEQLLQNSDSVFSKRLLKELIQNLK